MAVFGMHQRDQVTAVVDDQVRANFQHTADVRLILGRRGAVPGKDVEPVVCEGGCHVVLRGERIAARDVHVGAACCQHLAEVGRLGFQMDREGHLQAGERFFRTELGLQAIEQGHVMPHPLNLERTVLPQGGVSDFAVHV